ncbi:NnrS family protein [Halopseudomonas salegens]|uniref:Uncharacterized protein involved in response to NO n=1 Tax=Halopseudomonas salegens TaxID=1434072 RepID=A0A1H2F715_9GAMM|nr:NnrS family protein [Halopseudomonas salegens]SDU03144.1 uncharacterized protein involved in response to NO [Halopseudomonas salegens]
MALLQLGFRLFFLAGSAYAVIAAPLWVAALFGLVDHQPYADWLSWHRHEMMFGFVMAIVAGFLLTAVQNWTGRRGLSGWPLGGLVLFWLAARLAWLFNAPAWLLPAVDVCFALALAGIMLRFLLPVRQSRNYPIVVVLVLLGLANLVSHLGLLQNDYALHRQGVLAAIWLVIALVTLIAGRVIPFFTANGLGSKQAAKPLPWLDNGLLLGTVFLAVLHLPGIGLVATPWLSAVFVLLAAGHLTRLINWYQPGIWQVPLLWSLHLAYAWLVLGMLTLAAWHLGWANSFSQGLHLMTIGTMAGLILAMIARVSLGHTGRPLQPPATMTWGFVLLNLAVPLRVGLGSFYPHYGFWLASLCWSAAFVLFLYHYGPMLCRPRTDGKPG